MCLNRRHCDELLHTVCRGFDVHVLPLYQLQRLVAKLALRSEVCARGSEWQSLNSKLLTLRYLNRSRCSREELDITKAPFFTPYSNACGSNAVT
jgi:hypothetical protein